MGNIVLLDDLTINKIAAGEVIERPASVVKELVENSIDAGATKINIETKNGGITYIRITDNGKGFLPDDMEIAFERHATSKIREASDLETVTSMGFRGEALASIAAISDVELISKTADNEIGKRIEVKGGNVVSFEDAGCSQGSTITVTDLFYNTPVRYKFLKKDFTEAGYIEDVVTRIALVHPEIAIKLVNSGKVIIQTSGNGDMKSVIYSIYGKEIADNIININYEYEDIKVNGVIGKPVIARSNRSNQLFFVNKRYIKDKVLTSAAEQAYKGLITIGKYGFLVLNIEMNPQKVDVNVHPAKLEVRFEDENKIFKAIYHAIKDSLLKEDLIPDRTKIELDKQMNSNNSWKVNNGFGVPQGIKKEAEKPKYEEPKVDILEEINKMRNEPFRDFSLLNGKGNEKKQENESLKETNENYSTEENTNAYSVNNTSDYKEKNIEEQNNYKSQDTEISNYSQTQNTETQNSNQNEENEEHKDKSGSKLGELFSMFYNKKKQDEGTDIDDTQNFIAQIYNNKENNSTLQEDFNEMYARTFGTTIKEEPKEEQKNEKDEENRVTDKDLKAVENVSIFEKLPDNQTPQYKYVGIAFSTYIIIEMNNELYIIDQHAAHERILYEKVKANYYSNDNKDSQLMLLPDIINLSHKEMQIAKDNMDIFEKAGFILEEFGENTIKLSGVPTICLDLDTKELFLETLDEINTVARTAKQEIEERFIATVACKAAVKANMALTREEVDNLMRQLLVLPNPFTCPHGRPTAIRMTKYDIERKFSRK